MELGLPLRLTCPRSVEYRWSAVLQPNMRPGHVQRATPYPASPRNSRRVYQTSVPNECTRRVYQTFPIQFRFLDADGRASSHTHLTLRLVGGGRIRPSISGYPPDF